MYAVLQVRLNVSALRSKGWGVMVVVGEGVHGGVGGSPRREGVDCRRQNLWHYTGTSASDVQTH